MKTKLQKSLRVICALMIAIWIVGCATEKTGSDSSSAKQKQQQEKNPEVGMTKEQIVAMYGKTDNIQMSSEGETWVYHLNMGEAFIPFNFGYRPKIRVINFDKDGKVARWNYSK